MRNLGRGIIRLVTWALGWLSRILLVAIMFLTGISVVFRYALNSPIAGDYEITQYLMVGLVLFGMAFTEVEDGHIVVKLFVDRLSSRLRIAIGRFDLLLVALFLGLLIWQTFLDGIIYFHRGITTDILSIPLFICKFFLPVGFTVWFLQVLLKLLRSSNRQN